MQTQLEQHGPLPPPPEEPALKAGRESKGHVLALWKQEKLLESGFGVGVGVQAEAPSAWDQDQKARPEQDTRLTVYRRNHIRRAKDVSESPSRDKGVSLGRGEQGVASQILHNKRIYLNRGSGV